MHQDKLGSSPPEDTVVMFSQEGFKACTHIVFLSAQKINHFWPAFSPCWMWKLSKEMCFIYVKKSAQRERFLQRNVTRRGNSLLDFHLSAEIIPLFLLGFSGLKWQRLRDSFSKLVLLPSRHTLPGGVKLEIQGGFRGWRAQRRCGEHISAAPEVAGSDFKWGNRRRLELLIHPGWLPALRAQEWMEPQTKFC